MGNCFPYPFLMKLGYLDTVPLLSGPYNLHTTKSLRPFFEHCQLFFHICPLSLSVSPVEVSSSERREEWISASTAVMYSHNSRWCIDYSIYKSWQILRSSVIVTTHSDIVPVFLDSKQALIEMLFNEGRVFWAWQNDSQIRWQWFATGEKIITQGDTGNTFYIMFSGTVDVIKELRQAGYMGGRPCSTAFRIHRKSMLGVEKDLLQRWTWLDRCVSQKQLERILQCRMIRWWPHWRHACKTYMKDCVRAASSG